MCETGNQLQKLTECSICFKEFTDPRMLPCIHTFCLECLKQIGDAAKKKPGETMPCPLCRNVFVIPPEGMIGIQKNFFMEHLIDVTVNLQINNMSSIACDICKQLNESNEKTENATMRCLECGDQFCDWCAKAHALQKLSKTHHIVKIGSETEEDMRRISPTRNCIDHNQKPLDYYCPRCKKIICVSCLLESHGSHGCKDVSSVEEEFRQVIERNALQILTYADEMLSKGKRVEERKENILLKLTEIESEIRNRNLALKEMIDNHTKSLLEELSLIKQKHIKDFENEKEEIERIHIVLKSFETYCTELKSKGSASDICSCVEKLSERADELEKDHETFIGRPSPSTEVSYSATDLGDIQNTSSRNIVGRIQETVSQIENCVVITGLHDGQSLTKDVLKLNLHRPQEISTEKQIPTTMKNQASGAVYRNTFYVVGIGDNNDEIWKYNTASGWVKRSSLVQSRSGHCAELVDEILHICGGFVASEGRILDSVEAYSALTNKCVITGSLVHCVKYSGGCVSFRSSLYIFGGQGKDNSELNHVQVYNTKDNTCTLLSKPMPRSYMLMRAALWETSVILFGRHTCFIFNFETQTWQEREQYKTNVYHFGLALANGRIFVIGGGTDVKDENGKTKWTCRDDVRYVPLQSVIDDKPIEWKSYAKLPHPVLVQTYGKLCLDSLAAYDD